MHISTTNVEKTSRFIGGSWNTAKTVFTLNITTEELLQCEEVNLCAFGGILYPLEPSKINAKKVIKGYENMSTSLSNLFEIYLRITFGTDTNGNATITINDAFGRVANSSSPALISASSKDTYLSEIYIQGVRVK